MNRAVISHRSLTLRLALALLGLVLLSACGSNKSKELKPVALESVEAEVALDRKWSRRIGRGMGKYYHQFRLAVDEQHLYAAAADGRVYQLNKETGRVRWRVTLNDGLTSGVAVDQQHVYVATDAGVLLALDKQNGEQVWSRQLNSELVSPPSSTNNHVVLQTSSGSIYNLNAQTGEQRWRFDTTMPSLSLRGNSRPTFFASFVVLGQANGKLAVLDINTGELRWDPRIAHARGDTEIERMVDVNATPLLIDDHLFAVSYQGQLVAYDLSSGRPLWTVDESSFNDMARGMGNIYVSSSEGVVRAYDRRTGDVRWSQNSLLRRKTTAPTAISSYLVVADYQGYVHLLSQLDGRIVARARVSRKPVKTTLLAEGNRFYVIADNGRLRAYQIGQSLK